MIKKPQKYTEDNSAMIGQLANEIQNLKTNFNKAHRIGAANKKFIPLILEGGADDGQTTDMSFMCINYYHNAGAQDFYAVFGFPLPLTTNDLDGTAKNLIITSMKYYIFDSDAGDYIDHIYIRGYPAEAAMSALVDLDHNTVNGTGTGLFTWDFADQTIGGSYERIAIVVDIAATDGKDLDIAYFEMEYYYG